MNLSSLRAATNLLLTRNSPTSIVHFITERCNARCPHCFIDFDNPATNELSLTEIETLCTTLGGNLLNVNLTGGEPFLRDDIYGIASAYATKAKVRNIFITSNGYFTDRILAFASKFRQTFPDCGLMFSFSADHFPEEHNANRKVPGLFEKMLDTVHRLPEAAPGVHANVGITVSQWNYEHVETLYDYLVKEKGIRSLTATFVRNAGVFRISREEHLKVFAAYEMLAAKINDGMKEGVLTGYNHSSLAGRLKNANKKLAYENIRRVFLDNEYVCPCLAGSVFGVIGPCGQVWPCEVLDKKMGELRDFSLDFMRLWNSEEAVKIRQWIRDTNCRCTYECAWTINILGNPRYLPYMLAAAIGCPR